MTLDYMRLINDFASESLITGETIWCIDQRIIVFQLADWLKTRKWALWHLTWNAWKRWHIRPRASCRPLSSCVLWTWVRICPRILPLSALGGRSCRTVRSPLPSSINNSALVYAPSHRSEFEKLL